MPSSQKKCYQDGCPRTEKRSEEEEKEEENEKIGAQHICGKNSPNLGHFPFIWRTTNHS